MAAVLAARPPPLRRTCRTSVCVAMAAPLVSGAFNAWCSRSLCPHGSECVHAFAARLLPMIAVLFRSCCACPTGCHTIFSPLSHPFFRWSFGLLPCRSCRSYVMHLGQEHALSASSLPRPSHLVRAVLIADPLPSRRMSALLGKNTGTSLLETFTAEQIRSHIATIRTASAAQHALLPPETNPVWYRMSVAGIA